MKMLLSRLLEGLGVGMVVVRKRPTRKAQELRRNPTQAETHLGMHLSRRQLGGFKFSRQMPVGLFICDFLCREARLIVEVVGGQHAAQVQRDTTRTDYLMQEGCRVIRFWNHDVLENTDGVLDCLLGALRSPHPQPLPQAGGEPVLRPS